mgnify:CR=1 FL=1
MEKIEEKILELFLYNYKLKFNEIEKLTKIRSNKLTYHLKNLQKRLILVKEKKYYKLSEVSEYLIPYITNKNPILPVILIAIIKNKKIFLYKRQKRPYKDRLSLPGGRILLGENISKATSRIMKEKFNINCRLKKINSISLEQVKNKFKKTIHTFLLIFVTAKTKDKIDEKDYINQKNCKKNIIASDYNLITRDLNKKIKIKNIISRI